MEQTPTPITVQTVVHAPIETVWEYWTSPEHVKHWNAASDDWHCPTATSDLRVGGEFHYEMAARDGSASFDFNGIYNEVVPQMRIAYTIEGGRTVKVMFEETDGGVNVTETFEAEDQNPIELQRDGWQAILDRFKAHVESAE